MSVFTPGSLSAGPGGWGAPHRSSLIPGSDRGMDYHQRIKQAFQALSSNRLQGVRKK